MENSHCLSDSATSPEKIWKAKLDKISADDDTFTEFCCHLNTHLSSSSFIHGDTYSYTDAVVFKFLSVSGERIHIMKGYQYLVRWHKQVLAHRTHLLKKKGPLLPIDLQLPNAKVGEVFLRCALQPCPMLHIGQLRIAIMNEYFAQKYQSPQKIRLDDWDPVKIDGECVQDLLKDVQALGIDIKDAIYSSGYLGAMMAASRDLVDKGKAYVDDTPKEQMHKEILDGVESKCRNQSTKRNLELWDEMCKGSDVGQNCYLRGKIDMQHPNKYLRDPVYYYCSTAPHHLYGTFYKMYPTPEFASPFVDAAQGITHVLRSSSFRDKDALYDRILEDMQLPKVQICEVKRLRMEYTPAGTARLSWFVDNGKVDGWADPRLPTARALIRRGVLTDALRKFFGPLGLSMDIGFVKWDTLWAINRDMITTRGCPFHTAVLVQKRIMLTLTNVSDEFKNLNITLEQKYPLVLTRSKKIWLEIDDLTSISVGKEISLMCWGNALIESIKKDKDGHAMELTGVLKPLASPMHKYQGIPWLPVATNQLVNLSLVEFDYLLTKRKLEAGEDFLNAVNPCTKKAVLAHGDLKMCNLKYGDIVLLIGKGRFRCDVPFVSSSEPVVLFAIPDGVHLSILK